MKTQDRQTYNSLKSYAKETNTKCAGTCGKYLTSLDKAWIKSIDLKVELCPQCYEGEVV